MSKTKEATDVKEPSATRARVRAANRRVGASRQGKRRLAREFETSAKALRKSVEQVNLDEDLRSDGLIIGERAKLKRSRRENRVLRKEREITKQAARKSIAAVAFHIG
jgi:transposase-like protein